MVNTINDIPENTLTQIDLEENGTVIKSLNDSVFDVEEGLLAQDLLPYFSVKFEESPVAFDYKWSPDSQWIAYRQDNDLKIIKPDGTDKKTIAEDNVKCFAWDFDSSRVFYADSDGISVVDVSGEGSKRLIEKDGVYTFIKVSSDGKKMVYVMNGNVYFAELE